MGDDISDRTCEYLNNENEEENNISYIKKDITPLNKLKKTKKNILITIKEKLNLLSIPKNTTKCPHCHGENIRFIKKVSKKLSKTKFHAASYIISGRGIRVGFSGKNKKKNLWNCNNCEKLFKN